MSKVEIQRIYFKNGQIESEVTLVDGRPNGIGRTWHENGVLAQEHPCKDGKRHGVWRQWNEKGELLGSCEFQNGSGIFKEWFPNGQIKGEVDMVDGVPHGRMRVWFESGEEALTSFVVRGMNVSFKKYEEACKKDPSLRVYAKPVPTNFEREVAKERGTEQKRRDKLPEEVLARRRCRSESFITDLLAKPNKAEALGWLQATGPDEFRNLGEIPTTPESIELVKEIYVAGAQSVIACDIVIETDGQTTNDLLIETPKDPKKRKRLFRWYTKHTHTMGFDAERDYGQRYLFASFS